MPQFFVDTDLTLGALVRIRGAEARHILLSLRLAVGDWIVLSDGKGLSFRSTITHCTPTTVTCRIDEATRHRIATAPPALALALAKKDRFEWAIEKAVELGCSVIHPFISTRSSTDTKGLARWQMIALAAAKQCGVPVRPVVHEALPFAKLFDLAGIDRRIFFYEGEYATDLNAFWKDHTPARDLLIVGPEGGFTNDEVATARTHSAVTVSLGQRILRVETAVVTALAVWQYEAGDLAVK